MVAVRAIDGSVGDDSAAHSVNATPTFSADMRPLEVYTSATPHKVSLRALHRAVCHRRKEDSSASFRSNRPPCSSVCKVSMNSSSSLVATDCLIVSWMPSVIHSVWYGSG